LVILLPWPPGRCDLPAAMQPFVNDCSWPLCRAQHKGQLRLITNDSFMEDHLDLIEVAPFSRTLSNRKEESKMPKTKPPYAQGFRDQMVELVRSGRNPSDLSKEFGCHVTSILSWVRKAGGSGATMLPADVSALNAQERQELIELRRKLRQVQMERDILAKATAWFAGKSEKTFTPSTNS
jgi:transposase